MSKSRHAAYAAKRLVASLNSLTAQQYGEADDALEAAIDVTTRSDIRTLLQSVRALSAALEDVCNEADVSACRALILIANLPTIAALHPAAVEECVVKLTRFDG